MARCLHYGCLPTTTCNLILLTVVLAAVYATGSVPLHAQQSIVQWEWLAPQPTGANLQSVAVLGNNDVLVSDESGVLFRSTDAAKTWTRIPNTLGIKRLASTTLSCWCLTEPASLQLSQDAGESWQHVETNRTITSSCIDAFGTNIIASGESDVVVFSTDNGITWKSTTLPAFGIANTVVVGRAATTVFYAQNLQGKVVSISTSGDIIKEYPAPFNGAFQTFAVAPNGTLVMGTENKGIFRWSADDLFWSFSTLPLTRPVVSLFVNHSDTVFASLESGMIIWSNDNAKTFTVADTSLAPLKIFGFTELPSGSMVAVGSNGCIAVDEQHNAGWKSIAIRSRALITAITKIGISRLVVGDEHGTLLRFSNSEWSPLTSPTQGYITSIACRDGGPLMLCSRQQDSSTGLYRSSDDGDTWTKISAPELAGLPSFEGVQAGSASTFYGVVQGKLYRTSDAGASWMNIPLVVNTSELSLERTFSVVNANELWCTAYATDDLFHTTDGGISWTRVPHSGFGKPAFIVTAPSGIVGTGTSVSFNVSADSGTTWARTPETATLDDVAAASDNGSLAVYSQRTLYLRRPGNQVWNSFFVPVQDLPQRLVGSKAVCWLDNETIVISAGYGGLLRASISTVSSVPSKTSHTANLVIRGMHGSGNVVSNEVFDVNKSVAIYNINGQRTANATVCYEGDKLVLALNQTVPAGLYSVVETAPAENAGTSRTQPLSGYILVWQ